MLQRPVIFKFVPLEHQQLLLRVDFVQLTYPLLQI